MAPCVPEVGIAWPGKQGGGHHGKDQSCGGGERRCKERGSDRGSPGPRLLEAAAPAEDPERFLFTEVIRHGYPLVLMHGGPSLDHFTLLPFRQLADRFTLIFYDHRCNGRSVGLPSRP
jgi:pimeloyl-ACP methyl ester carboxylesterase